MKGKSKVSFRKVGLFPLFVMTRTGCIDMPIHYNLNVNPITYFENLEEFLMFISLSPLTFKWEKSDLRDKEHLPNWLVLSISLVASLQNENFKYYFIFFFTKIVV